MGTMTRQERLALVHSLLDLPEDLVVVDYVTVAHLHQGEECEGAVRVAGNMPPAHAVPLLAKAIVHVSECGVSEGDEEDPS